MKNINPYRFILTAVFTAMLAANAYAHDYKIGDIEIEHPWARASVGQVKSGGAYMKIENEGNTPDRLIAVSSPVAKKTHLHTMFMENNIMKMRPVDAIDIPANAEIALKPGGFHVMFMGLHAPLMEGETFPLTLRFENAGNITIQVYIDEHGAMESMDGMEMGN